MSTQPTEPDADEYEWQLFRQESPRLVDQLQVLRRRFQSQTVQSLLRQWTEEVQLFGDGEDQREAA